MMKKLLISVILIGFANGKQNRIIGKNKIKSQEKADSNQDRKTGKNIKKSD